MLCAVVSVDDDMWRIIHDTVFCSNNAAVAKLLVDGGADVNIRDDDGVAPLAVATACGHMDVLKVLLDHPNIDVDTQVPFIYMYVSKRGNSDLCF